MADIHGTTFERLCSETISESVMLHHRREYLKMLRQVYQHDKDIVAKIDDIVLCNTLDDGDNAFVRLLALVRMRNQK